MNVVFCVGPMASGKSTVARSLQDLGAWRIDLDEASRQVTAPGSPCAAELARAFGEDILAADGSLDRALLAERAFASPEATERLEAIELPYIKRTLIDALSYASTVAEEDDVVIVEVPLLDRVEELLPLADEVLYVHASEGARRDHAHGRGVGEEDFARRSSAQPGDGYYRSHATTVIENDGTEEELLAKARAWFEARGGRGARDA